MVIGPLLQAYSTLQKVIIFLSLAQMRGGVIDTTSQFTSMPITYTPFALRTVRRCADKPFSSAPVMHSLPLTEALLNDSRSHTSLQRKHSSQNLTDLSASLPPDAQPYLSTRTAYTASSQLSNRSNVFLELKY
jgi:hypothetical protein